MKFCPTLLILVLLQSAISIGWSEVSDKQLQDLVDKSTLTFIGTVKELGTNVSGIDSKESVIVRVDSVECSDQQAMKKFGDLQGNRLTVALNPISRIVMKTDISAVFFADPLVYEKYIGVVGTAIPLPDSKGDFLNKLHAAALRKSEAPLRTEVNNAPDLIIVGEVVAVGPLPSTKATALASVKNGWELRSEHRPRWADAIIKVTRRIDKPEPKPDFVSVIFPRSHDCLSQDSPKFEEKEKGIWLLFQNKQLAEAEKKVLLKPEKYDGRDIQSYTALRPADFQDMSMLEKIQDVIAETR
ncbi:MAG: hypothetical protein QOH96_1584 [Blastocatellia bacterium]|nr:hypothetical protein [Blastocatellia bacterium]